MASSNSEGGRSSGEASSKRVTLDHADRNAAGPSISQSQSGSSSIARSESLTTTVVPKAIPALSPAPAFLEQHRRPKDDTFIILPETPRRPGLGLRGVSLQLSVPSRDTAEATTPTGSPYKSQRVPPSPKLDTSVSYSPGGSVLPRRSRGMDYTRACTNLHHSTLAEQSSPDSSPVIGGKGMSIPRRGHSGNSGPDSPMFPTSHWSTASNADAKTLVSSSVGSVNLLGSGSDTSSSDDDMVGDEDDTIHMTPQPFKNNNIFGITAGIANSTDIMSPFQQAAASLMSFQRRARRTRSTRHSSSSASGRSSMASPIPGSPPILKSEFSLSGYFEKESKNKKIESRRESLSLGTGDLHISDSIEENNVGQSQGAEMNSSSNAEERRNVIRRAVTRRSNMLPKPKTFARIRAALQEEISPVDTESKREAEVIRQVRDNDDSPDSTVITTQPPTTVSSPCLQPLILNNGDAVEEIIDIMNSEAPRRERSASSSFSRQALRNSIGADFWNNFDGRVRTPPPPFFGRGSSSGISEDVNMDTPASSIMSATRNSSPSRSTTPQPSQTGQDSTRKSLGKRRRDDDLDPYLYKRRAVSPGFSHQNSPVLPPSPAQRDGGFWQTKAGGERGSTNEKPSSAGNLTKRVGIQGMNDTNDGLMNMSIE